MASNQKDIIYIDNDDEITAIIDKVRSSGGRIVALVLPKRATVLQSVVNMKLLKRTAESSKKHMVLITSEAGLLPLAGAVGMHVAASLQSKPAIPSAGTASDEPAAATDEDFDLRQAADKPVGQLAGIGAAAAVAKPVDDTETIELDNGSDAPAAAGGLAGAAAVTGTSAAGKAAKKNKKLAVPDFNKFRLALAAGGAALVGLLVFLYFAAFVMPKATVTIATDSSNVTTNASIKLDPAATAVDVEASVLPAKIEQKQQTGSQQVSSTGQTNKGAKASGSVTLSLANCDVDEVTVPAGTGVSAGGHTFITQSSATLESAEIGGKCQNASFKDVSTEKVSVVAQRPGNAYNIPAGDFTVAGFENVSGASDDPMTGGTDDIVKSVTQADIDSAKQKIGAQDSASVRTDLKEKLEAAGYMAVASSLHSGEPTVTTSANVGDESDTVTVTQATSFTMYGIKKADLRQLILENVESKIDPKKQKILNDGTDKATFDITTPTSSGVMTAALSASTLAGPDINTDAIAAAIKGKKTNDVRTYIRSTPGVTDVTVKYSPFWVTKVPSKESKITVIVDKADATTNGSTRR